MWEITVKIGIFTARTVVLCLRLGPVSVETFGNLVVFRKVFGLLSLTSSKDIISNSNNSWSGLSRKLTVSLFDIAFADVAGIHRSVLSLRPGRAQK